MSTPAEPTAQEVKAILAQWRQNAHSKEDEEALESADVMRELFDGIKQECPAAAAACDKAMEKFERNVLQAMVADAISTPLGKIPRSDTTLMPDAEDK